MTATTHTAHVAEDLALTIGAITPKKKKKKKGARKEVISQQEAKTIAPAAHTNNSLVPIIIPWFYGVKQIACGHSHTMALLDYDHRLMQVVRDGDIPSLKDLFADSEVARKHKNEDHHHANNFTVIHWTVERNHHKALQYLLTHYSSLIERLSCGQTPLILAAAHGREEIITILLAATANVHARDLQGNTALHYAAHLKRIDICSQLILGGANADMENKNSKRPLEFFALHEVFELKKKIGGYDIAIYCANEDLEFSQELKAQIESFHIVCSLNEDGNDHKLFIKGSRALIFVLSNYSAPTQDSLTVLRLARDLKRHVYPIWRQKATMSSVLESLIYRNQLVDFTDSAKFVDSTAQLVGGLRNIFEDKKAATEQDTLNDDQKEVDEAYQNLVEHPNMNLLPDDLLDNKRQYLYLCHDVIDNKKATLLAAALCDHGFIVSYYNDDPSKTGELISNCWTFLLVLSSRSAGSSIVQDQIALAENRQKLILPVQVQKSKITLDPAMTYTLARVARFPFFIGDNDVTACVDKLVEAIRLAKQVSEKSEKLKGLREEVVVATDKLNKSNAKIKEFKSKVEVKKKVINVEVKKKPRTATGR